YFGARYAKYKIERGLPGMSMGNDLVIYRLADIMLMKAEALMRKNGSATQEAVDLVNRVRARAFKRDPSPHTVA
ncbi:MAG: RagB/SusD family nutrient uptake outer membrane protein, partial [Candidatus Nephrothrix sp. EaCA]